MSFEQALAFVLAREGAYVDNPRDRGGATNHGITQAVYDRYRLELGLPQQPVRYLDDAETRAIYLEDYWIEGACDRMPDRLATVHFDACVQHGIHGAAKLLQRALGIEDDGVIGWHTMQAIAAADEDGLIARYLAQRRAFYRDIVARDPTQTVFLHGWLNRVALLEKAIASGEAGHRVADGSLTAVFGPRRHT